MNEKQTFANIIGTAAIDLWPDLPRDIQEKIFEAAVAPDSPLRYDLALFLHQRHPRTAHPPIA